MHDARTCRTTEIPQSDRVVGTTRHERVIRGRHFQTDDSFRVALEIPQEFVVVQGKVPAIGSRHIDLRNLNRVTKFIKFLHFKIWSGHREHAHSLQVVLYLPDIIVHFGAGVNAGVFGVCESRQVDSVLLRVDQPALHAALAVEDGNLIVVRAGDKRESIGAERDAVGLRIALP